MVYELLRENLRFDDCHYGTLLLGIVLLIRSKRLPIWHRWPFSPALSCSRDDIGAVEHDRHAIGVGDIDDQIELALALFFEHL